MTARFSRRPRRALLALHAALCAISISPLSGCGSPQSRAKSDTGSRGDALSATAEAGTSDPTPSATHGRLTPTTVASLDGDRIFVDDAAFRLPVGPELTAFPPLVRTLTSRAKGSALPALGLRVHEETPARTIVRVLASAERSGFHAAFLKAPGGPFEIAVPESERVPPLRAADVFFSILGESVSVSHALADLGSTTTSTPSAALGDPAALDALLGGACSAGAACTHAVFSTAASTTFGQMLPLLSALQGQAKTVRWAISASNAQASGQRASDPALTAQALTKTIEAERPKLIECHHGGERGAEVLGGTLALVFEVTRLGIVFDATVNPEHSTLSDPAIIECVIGVVTRLKFPKPKAETTVEHIIRF